MSEHMERAVQAARETPIAHEHYECITESIMCPSCTAAMLRAALPHLLEAVLGEWERTRGVVYRGESYNDYVCREMRAAARRIAEGA